MRVFPYERVIPCDIDETLVLHEKPLQYARQITIEDPLAPGKFITLGVNEPMLKIVEDEIERGAFIIFWSRSGYAWAEAVTHELGLVAPHHSIICTKPVSYIDDKDASEWLKDRVYVNPNFTYKKHNQTKENE